VDESGITGNQMGTQNKLEMVTVKGSPCKNINIKKHERFDPGNTKFYFMFDAIKSELLKTSLHKYDIQTIPCYTSVLASSDVMSA
jgi:hypothetical protein